MFQYAVYIENKSNPRDRRVEIYSLPAYAGVDDIQREVSKRTFNQYSLVCWTENVRDWIGVRNEQAVNT